MAAMHNEYSRESNPIMVANMACLHVKSTVSPGGENFIPAALYKVRQEDDNHHYTTMQNMDAVPSQASQRLWIQKQ